VKNPLHLLPFSSKCCAIKVSKDAQTFETWIDRNPEWHEKTFIEIVIFWTTLVT
jgi:hypothetical protein